MLTKLRTPKPILTAAKPTFAEPAEHARSPNFDYGREILLTQAFLAFTLIAWLAVSWQTAGILWNRIQAGTGWAVAEQLLFIVIIQGLIYGNFVYQLTRLGYLKRRLTHERMPAEELEALYDTQVPSLAVLVPSYKEEISVIKRTLLSAALQDYPQRRIVLLIDDPAFPANPWDQKALEAARQLPVDLQAVFGRTAMPYVKAQKDFISRVAHAPMDMEAEAQRLAGYYEMAADWVMAFAAEYPIHDHGDQLLKDKVFSALVREHLDRAASLRRQSGITPWRIHREYKRLAALFHVEFASFERKRYVNLSHESNKAMNLNSYIRLLGRSWSSVSGEEGLYLEQAPAGKGELNIPDSEFLITLDADSLLVPEYALVLVNEMLREGNERLAVAQTPYNTLPNPASELERIAGATTDIQYLVHQGFTQYGATYWVGANALLRTEALADIKTTIRERGFDMPVFIQDRTVIEDTESSIDLVACGWRLFNYPERLAYSATPPDFGSLLIQRRRWANGGLIILPKLLRYLAVRPSWAKMKEGFFRVHYLSSITVVNVGLLITLGHSFENSIEGIWLPLTALPYFILFARDLRYNGGRMRDLFPVYALNLLLIPVNLGGVLKSLQQAMTGQRIPFGRTPKVVGRTAAPALYTIAEYGLVAWWLAGVGINLAAGHHVSAIFCLANALMLFYAIAHFIGFAESWEDIKPRRPARGKLRAKEMPNIHVA